MNSADLNELALAEYFATVAPMIPKRWQTFKRK
jgi:hypothetical protein